MSLLDGHPQLLVYPDEPSFGRLFKRQQHYISSRHLAADFLFGTPNSIHLAHEVGSSGIKDKKKPAVSESMYNSIDDIFQSTWLNQKKLRGLRDENFRHHDFFVKYYKSLIPLIKNCDDLTPKKAVSFAYVALENACPSNTNPYRIRTFKGPLSGVSYAKLDWFRQNYKGPIVFIHRNPYARLYSQILQFRAKNRPEIAPRFSESILGFIRLCVKNACEQFEAKKIARAPGVVSIHYEELVTNCSGTMQKLCEQLSIDFKDIVLHPTKLGIPVKNPTDRTDANHGGISAASIYKYKKGLTPIEKILFSITLAVSKFIFLLKT